jgi:hypothetical protein
MPELATGDWTQHECHLSETELTVFLVMKVPDGGCGGALGGYTLTNRRGQREVEGDRYSCFRTLRSRGHLKRQKDFAVRSCIGIAAVTIFDCAARNMNARANSLAEIDAAGA